MFIFKKGSAAAASLLCAAIGGVVVVTDAQASGDPGWYVGVEGFATKPDKVDASSPGVPGSTGGIGTPASSCLVPLDLLGTNIGLLGTCILGPGTPAIPGAATSTTIPAQRFKYNFKFGPGGGATFGYAFENGFRPELNINYSSANIKQLALTQGFGDTAGNPADPSPHNSGGKVETLRLMTNAWYDLNLGRILPYVGGGIGVQQTKTDVPGLINGTDTGFGFQVGGGVGFQITNNLTLSADYRYVVTDNPKYNGPLNEPVSTSYTSNNFGMSLRYSLGNGDPDSDGDGVPDRLDHCPNTPPGVSVYSDGCPTDLDGDGVPDYLDQCPGTPHGVAVDTHGCPLDSDGDGIPDYLDKCPGTAPGIAVDTHGCELADSDGDGVPDSLDKCPNTPRGQKVGPDGCPLDSDGDGIPDDQDACPNTPPGLKVLPDGCAPVGDCRKPRPGEKTDARGCAVDKRFVLRGVKFEFDSDRLTDPAKLVLNDVAETLSSYPQIRLDVEGHTDSLGTEAYNLGLSERRANSVIRYLGEHGTTTQRLKAVGYGESVPIDTNETEAGRENNRRVEFKVTGE